MYPILLEYTQRHPVKFLTINNDLDWRSQDSREVKMWNYLGLDVPDYVKLIPAFSFDDPKHKEIDVESLPGHIHSLNTDDRLRFGASWQMYFSDTYYKYIPKKLFDDFKDCEENIILENGLRRITLYKDPNDFLNPENRKRQWAFRKQLGIDTIAHELIDVSEIDPGLPVVVTQKNCEKGKTRVIRFLDKKDNLVPPANAVKKEITEYLEDGITLVLERVEPI